MQLINKYNPGLRNHPNLRGGNSQQQPSPPPTVVSEKKWIFSGGYNAANG